MADIQVPSAQSSRGRSHTRGGGRAPHTTRQNRPKKSQADETEVDQFAALRKTYKDELEQLKEMFPNWTDVDLLMALDDFDGDLFLVIERISTGTVSKFTEVTISKPAQRGSSVAAAQSAQPPRPQNSSNVTSGNNTRQNRKGGPSERGRGSGRGGKLGSGTTRSTSAMHQSYTNDSQNYDSFYPAKQSAAPSATPATAYHGGAPAASTWKAPSSSSSSQPRTWAKLFRQSPPPAAAVPATKEVSNENDVPELGGLSISDSPTAAANSGAGISSAGFVPDSGFAPDNGFTPDNGEEEAPVEKSADDDHSTAVPEINEPEVVEEESALLTETNVEALPDVSKTQPTETTVSVTESQNVEHGTTKNKAVPTAPASHPSQSTADSSSSLQRQSTPVILPNRVQLSHKASGVQFGTLGINSTASSTRNQQPDQSRSRQQQSMRSPPRVALPLFNRQVSSQQQSQQQAQPQVQQQTQPQQQAQEQSQPTQQTQQVQQTQQPQQPQQASQPQETLQTQQPQVQPQEQILNQQAHQAQQSFAQQAQNSIQSQLSQPPSQGSVQNSSHLANIGVPQSQIQQSVGPAQPELASMPEPEPNQAQIPQPSAISYTQSSHSTAPAFAPGLPIPSLQQHQQLQAQHQHQQQQHQQHQAQHQQHPQHLQQSQISQQSHPSQTSTPSTASAAASSMNLQHPQSHPGLFSYNQFNQQHSRPSDAFPQSRDTPTKLGSDLSAGRFNQQPIPTADFYSHNPGAFMPEPSVSQPQESSTVNSRPSELSGASHAPQPRYPDHYSMYPNPMPYGAHNGPHSVQHFGGYGHNQWNRPYYYPPWNGQYRQGAPYSGMNVPGFGGPSVPGHEGRGVDYGRDPASQLGPHVGQGSQPPGFGGVQDRFGAQASLGVQGQQYGQPGGNPSQQEDSLKGFGEPKPSNGSSGNGLGQTGRPGSAANTAAGHQASFAGYPQRYAAYNMPQWGYGGN